MFVLPFSSGQQKGQLVTVNFCLTTWIMLNGFPFHRGARTTIKDGGGLTALERRMELGAITDEDLFILFVRYDQD